MSPKRWLNSIQCDRAYNCFMLHLSWQKQEQTDKALHSSSCFLSVFTPNKTVLGFICASDVLWCVTGVYVIYTLYYITSHCVKKIPLTLHNITLLSVYTVDPVRKGKSDIFHIIRMNLDLGATDEQKALQSIWMQNSCLIFEKVSQRFQPPPWPYHQKHKFQHCAGVNGAESPPRAAHSVGPELNDWWNKRGKTEMQRWKKFSDT